MAVAMATTTDSLPEPSVRPCVLKVGGICIWAGLRKVLIIHIDPCRVGRYKNL